MAVEIWRFVGTVEGSYIWQGSHAEWTGNQIPQALERRRSAWLHGIWGEQFHVEAVDSNGCVTSGPVSKHAGVAY